MSTQSAAATMDEAQRTRASLVQVDAALAEPLKRNLCKADSRVGMKENKRIAEGRERGRRGRGEGGGWEGMGKGREGARGEDHWDQ